MNELTTQNSSIPKKEANQLQLKKIEIETRKKEINQRKKRLYQFLAGYKQNSAIFVNNFLEKRDYQTYSMDKFDYGKFTPNVFDEAVYSNDISEQLNQLEEQQIAYYPITREYMEQMINLARILELSVPIEQDTVFYRGCSTIEKSGMNGIVSVTSDYEVAKQFSRGTILIVHVPEGTQNLNINAISPKKRNNDFEQEFLLPPCEYEILSCREVKTEGEPNNHTGRTKLIEIKVKPLDLLEEFLDVMKNPPEEYLPIMSSQSKDYEAATIVLEKYIEQKNKWNKVLIK